MNTTPNAGLSHPLVAAYLSDLERALSSADPQERIDTIAAVREHLADALAGEGLDADSPDADGPDADGPEADRPGADGEPTTERVRAVLDELGSVELIAASATPAAATGASTPPTTTSPAETKQERGWAAPALLAVSIVSLLIPIFGAVLAIGCIITAVVLLRSGAPRRNFLHGSIAVSIVTLLITAVLVVGSLALFTARTEVSNVSGGPVPSIASVAPAP